MAVLEGDERWNGMCEPRQIHASGQRRHPDRFPCYEVVILNDNLQHVDCTVWHRTKIQESTPQWHHALSSLSTVQLIQTIEKGFSSASRGKQRESCPQVGMCNRR